MFCSFTTIRCCLPLFCFFAIAWLDGFFDVHFIVQCMGFVQRHYVSVWMLLWSSAVRTTLFASSCWLCHGSPFPYSDPRRKCNSHQGHCRYMYATGQPLLFADLRASLERSGSLECCTVHCHFTARFLHFRFIATEAMPICVMLVVLSRYYMYQFTSNDYIDLRWSRMLDFLGGQRRLCRRLCRHASPTYMRGWHYICRQRTVVIESLLR